MQVINPNPFLFLLTIAILPTNICRELHTLKASILKFLFTTTVLNLNDRRPRERLNDILIEQRLLNPIKIGTHMERRCKNFDKKGFGKAKQSGNQKAEENLGDVRERLRIRPAFQSTIEDEMPSEEDEAEPEAVLDGMAKAVDEVQHPATEEKVAFHEEDDDANGPAGDEAAAH